MKAELTTEGKTRNPLYSASAHAAAESRGEEYAFDRFMIVPVGTVIEDKNAWLHCVPGEKNAPAKAKPADDECRERVRKWMEEQRPVELEKIRLMALPDNLKRMSKKAREHVEALAEAYGLNGVTEPVDAEAKKKLAERQAAEAKSKADAEAAKAKAEADENKVVAKANADAPEQRANAKAIATKQPTVKEPADA